MTGTYEQDEFDFNPMKSPHREDPHLFYRAARARDVAFSPSLGAYMVSRYEDIMHVLNDPGTFSSSPAVPWIYDNPPEVVAELKAGDFPETSMLVNEDEPKHCQTRALFDAAVSGARIRSLLPLMHQRAGELIDGFDDRTDLVAEYAVPFVQTIISAIIGFPPEDTQRVQAWTDGVCMLWNTLAPVPARVEAARQMADYTRYMQALIDDRRAHPRDDMISILVHGINGIPGLTDEAVHSLVRGTRFAGFDSTRDAITATALAALRSPRVRAQLAADPAKTMMKVIEESLRRDAPHRSLFRVTTREVSVGGTPLPAGALLLLLFGSANRDEAKFPCADELDLDRENVREHVAFGKGLHVCPGAPLSRAEIRVALQTLFGRLPNLRLADGYEPTYIASYMIRGLESLEVCC